MIEDKVIDDPIETTAATLARTKGHLMSLRSALTRTRSAIANSQTAITASFEVLRQFRPLREHQD